MRADDTGCARHGRTGTAPSMTRVIAPLAELGMVKREPTRPMDGRPSCHWPLAEPTRSPKNSPRARNGSTGGSPNSPPRSATRCTGVVGIMDKIIHSADDIG